MGLQEYNQYADMGDVNSVIVYIKILYNTYKDNYIYTNIATILSWIVSILLSISQLFLAYKNFTSFLRKRKNRKRLEWMTTKLTGCGKNKEKD